eukprot:2529102-Amphidinium_carterae.1
MNNHSSCTLQPANLPKPSKQCLNCGLFRSLLGSGSERQWAMPMVAYGVRCYTSKNGTTSTDDNQQVCEAYELSLIPSAL